MKTCLICEKKPEHSSLMCKLCAMGVRSMHKRMGFIFCSEKCAEIFEDIYEKAGFEEREALLSADIVI